VRYSDVLIIITATVTNELYCKVGREEKDLPGSGDEDVMEDWLKLLSSPLPLFFVRFSSGLTFLCFVSFFFSCSPFLPQCLPSIVVLLVLFFGFLPFSSVSVLFMFFFSCVVLCWLEPTPGY